MLDRVPELALLVADSLPLVDLSHLSLVNRSLHALCRPRLFKEVELVSGNPWTDDVEEQEKQATEIERKVDSLLSASDSTLKLVKHLSIVGCDWTASEAGMKKLSELTKKLKLDGVKFLHHAGKTYDEKAHSFAPLWPTLAAQSLSTLTVLGRPRPQQAVGRLIQPCDLHETITTFATFATALPPALTTLTLSSVFIRAEDEDVFPSSFFRNLQTLNIVQPYLSLLNLLARSFETILGDPGETPALEHLSLDFHAEHELRGWAIDLKDTCNFLRSFEGASLRTLSIGSTGIVSSFGINALAYTPERDILGLWASPTYEAEHVKQLVSTISSTFRSLQDLTLRLDPRSEGWYEKLEEEEDLVEIVQSLTKLPDLRCFTTNALLPRDDLPDASSADTESKQEEEDDLPPPASLLESTARFFLTHLSTLEAASLVEVLEVPHEAFLKSKKVEEEEKKKKVRRTWRAVRGEKEGEEIEMVEVM